jgi:hypothetical protein
MSLVVVRCPGCLGPSRVEADAIGQMVACPRCEVPFIAAEEIVPTVQPQARPRTAATRPSVAKTVAPARRRRQPPREETPPAASADKPKAPDPEHDPHLPHVAGLPVSVLVGLALLPFGIPLLWWAAPTITGKEATLSLAVPISLAIAASTLCLGVVYTIDWTGITRIKGVLMLVCLAYMSAAGLYFLKKDMLDRVRGFFEPKAIWTPVYSKDGKFRVRMPGAVEDTNAQPIPKVQMKDGKKATYVTDSADEYRYQVMAGTLEKPFAEPPDPAWYAEIGHHLEKSGRLTEHSDVKLVRGVPATGRQWVLQDGEIVRVVRVYVAEGRVYYLSVEGRKLSLDETEVDYFFQSFEIVKPIR